VRAIGFRSHGDKSVNQATLYTSVPPSLKRQSRHEDYGEAYQRECINSWRAAGFRVVSLNSDAEIEGLRGKGFDVEFASNGSPNGRTKIGDFLSAMSSSDGAVAGIINADCYLMSPGETIQSILDSARGSLVVLRRVSLDPDTMRPTGIYCHGFDAFVFDTRFAPKIADGGDWSIGEPFWDYWFPLAMYIAGAQLKAPEVPMLVHLGHEEQWRFDTSKDSKAKLWRKLIALHREQRLPPQLSQAVEKAGLGIQPDEIGTIALLKCIVPWLKSFPMQTRPSLPGSPGDFVCRMLAGLEGSEEFQLRRELGSVTLAHWLRANRRRVGRVLNRVRSRLDLFFGR
jgi:hypothetical protein